VGKIDFQVDPAYHAFELAADHPTVARAEAAMRGAGLEPKSIVVRGGLDASWLNRYGVPTIALGMGLRKPHTKEEYLLRREFEQASEVCLALALGE
jgi:tripeptide aminopeptidase